MEKKPKIYFAASIRGGRDDVELYRELINYMQTFGKVLTEHIGLDSLKASGMYLPFYQTLMTMKIVTMQSQSINALIYLLLTI